MLDDIHRYTTSVKNGTLRCNLDSCPHCGQRTPGFTRHDARRRTFLVVVDGFIHRVLSAITRWECASCDRRFTYYPPFALQYKRYVQDTVLEKATRYLEEPEGTPVTYRAAVRESNRAVAYASQEDGRIDERQLVPSTVHRWLTTLGTFPTTLRTALRLIKVSVSSSEVFRTILPVSPRKYRSERRQEVLGNGRRLLQAEREYRARFRAAVFPYLATVCAWK